MSTFAEVYTEQKVHRDSRSKYRDDCQNGYTKALEGLFKVKFPRRKVFNFKAIENMPEVPELKKIWMDCYESCIKASDSIDESFDVKLDELAQSEEPVRTSIPGLVNLVYAGTYGSQ